MSSSTGPGDPKASGDEGSTSNSLLVQARSGDADAWRRLHGLYAPFVLHVARRAGLKESDAWDVCQEVFVAISKGLSGFRRGARHQSFRAWVRTITRNKVHDSWRRGERQVQGVGGTEAQRHLDEGGEGFAIADARMDALETEAEEQVLRMAMDRIRAGFSESTWRAFALTVLSGRAPKDAAQALGMSPGAVRVAKSRVLARLRHELFDGEDTGGGPGDPGAPPTGAP